MVAVREGEKQFGLAALRGATVYASGEPCAMCAGAMFWAGVSRIVFAASQEDITRVLGASPVLPINTRVTLAGANPPVQVEGPLLGDEAVAVLEKFAARH
jgi:tRNA(adenine34) deaminase